MLTGALSLQSLAGFNIRCNEHFSVRDSIRRSSMTALLVSSVAAQALFRFFLTALLNCVIKIVIYLRPCFNAFSFYFKNKHNYQAPLFMFHCSAYTLPFMHKTHRLLV